jgi:hypothetical protein
MLDPRRTYVLIELAGEDKEPVSHVASRSGEDVGEFGNPIWPFLPSGIVGKCIGGLPDGRNNRRDPVKRVVAWTSQDLWALGAAMVEGAMPVAGDLNDNLTHGRIVAAEGMMVLCPFAAQSLFCALVAESAEWSTPSCHLRPPFATGAGRQIVVMGRL